MPNFSPEQFITLVTVIVSAIATMVVSVVAAVVSLQTARINNRAKLSEMAFEKRLEALSRLYEALSQLHKSVSSYIRLQNTAIKEGGVSNYAELMDWITLDPDRQECYNDYHNSIEGFISASWKYRVLLPKHIDSLVHGYYTEIIHTHNQSLTADTTQWKVFPQRLKENLTTMKKNIITEIHKFIGYE